MFGVVFPDRSYPIDATSFTPVGPLHWILDMNAFPDKSASFSLTTSPYLPTKLLQLTSNHTTPHPSSSATPSTPLAPQPSSPFPGPTQPTSPTHDQVVDAASQGKMERLAMRVGENQFNFMQSFCGVDGDHLVVPFDILDRWFVKFQEKARKDPEFLKGFSL